MSSTKLLFFILCSTLNYPDTATLSSLITPQGQKSSLFSTNSALTWFWIHFITWNNLSDQVFKWKNVDDAYYRLSDHFMLDERPCLNYPDYSYYAPVWWSISRCRWIRKKFNDFQFSSLLGDKQPLQARSVLISSRLSWSASTLSDIANYSTIPLSNCLCMSVREEIFL